MLERDRTELKMPRPVSARDDDEGYTVYSKGDKALLRIDKKDNDTVFAVLRILNGLVAADIQLGELEQLRDLVQEIVGS